VGTPTRVLADDDGTRENYYSIIINLEVTITLTEILAFLSGDRGKGMRLGIFYCI